MSLIVTTLGPDGATETVELETSEEVEKFVAKNRRLRAAYGKAIMRRGFKRLAPGYDATVSPSCSDRWLTSGRVTVKQDEFRLKISQAGKAISGVVVEHTVALVLAIDVGEPPASPLALRGRYGKTIELRDAQSTCRISLRARTVRTFKEPRLRSHY